MSANAVRKPPLYDAHMLLLQLAARRRAREAAQTRAADAGTDCEARPAPAVRAAISAEPVAQS